MTGIMANAAADLKKSFAPIGFMTDRVINNSKIYNRNSYLFAKLIPAKKQARYAVFLLPFFKYFVKNRTESKKALNAYTIAKEYGKTELYKKVLNTSALMINIVKRNEISFFKNSHERR